MHWNRVLYRYCTTRSAASWCNFPGRQLCLDSLAAAKAMSGHVEIAAYRIEPIFLWYSVLSASSTSSSAGKGYSSSSAIGVGGPFSALEPGMNSLASFSMYACWESQRDLLGLSLKM